LNAQDQVDPLEAARLAKSAAEKAQAEADAATEAAIQAAVEKAASQARSNAIQPKEDEKARKLAEANAAEEAELDALAKAAGDEAKRKVAQELGLDDGSSEEYDKFLTTARAKIASDEAKRKISQKLVLDDDRLSWLLTNPDNIDKLDEDKSKIIKSELSKILGKFNNEVTFTPTSHKETKSVTYTLDKDEYYRLRQGGMDETSAEYHATRKSRNTKNVIKKRGFDLNVHLSGQAPEWSDIVEYYGGYSELTGAGITKDDLYKFQVFRSLKRVEIVDPIRCVAIIEEKGMKDYGLKYYNIKQTQKIIYGTFQLDDFTITDLYYISKSDRNNSPKIEFTFTDQELVQSKQDVFIKSVIDINNKIVELSKPHLSTIKLMINDLVPLSYYNTFNHRKELLQKQIENVYRGDIYLASVKEAKKDDHFSYFDQERRKAIRQVKKHLFDYMLLHNNTLSFQEMKKRDKLIKKYERKTNKKALDQFKKYSDDFLEYYYNNLKKKPGFFDNYDSEIRGKIIATREKVNKIGATTDCRDLEIYIGIGKLKQCSYGYTLDYGFRRHRLPLQEWLPGINE